MRVRISIVIKLLLFIIPLVCVPIALVGYFSIQASEERVNRLVRQEQMVQVDATAQKINAVFQKCRADLGTIAASPVLEDFHLARLFRLQAEAEFNLENLEKLFRDILARTPEYARIRFLNRQGGEIIDVGRGESKAKQADSGQADYFLKASALGPQDIHLSGPVKSAGDGSWLVYSAKPFFTGWRELAGVVVIDLDFGKISQIVRAIHVGQEGYSFLVDHAGKVLAHPAYAPYRMGLDTIDDPALRQMLGDMIAGRTGWTVYSFEGQRKVAAYAPIPTMGWSLAVTIPMEEFGREAGVIRGKVIQVVVFALIATLLGVSILSYNLLRPVRRLVAATQRMAAGDLDQEIPVRSRDELGDLTRSFNLMVSNLSRIQQELVRSEKLISLGRLSAGVAHEIRNPLNAMKGAMVHLQQRWASEPLIQQYTQLVSEEIDRLNRVVTDFLYFAKQSPPKLEAVDLNEIILGTQRLLADEAAQGHVSFRNYLDPALPEVWLDTHQLEQVLLNLIINAMEAMGDQGGEISFATSLLTQDGPSQARVVLEDDGPGISQENLPNVLDPFFTTKEDGTGLGLPLSLGIMEGHGGSLSLGSRPGGGTKITLILPLGRPGMA
ncbi:MAG: cache domain-containing protein [Pseudomonadota bacterium]